MLDTVITLIWLVIIVVGLTIYTTYHKSSGEKALQKWAEREGHTIIDSEWKWALYGPFFFTCTSQSQRVFKVTLRTKDGRLRKAWVRLGGYFLGLMSDQVDVKWKD